LKNLFQSLTSGFISKEEENQLYEKAGIDIENGVIDKGLWTKALSKAEGDKKKQQGIYIELIVERHKDELRVAKKKAKTLEDKKKKKDEVQAQEINTRYRAKQWKRLNREFPKTITFAVLINVLIFIYAWGQLDLIGAVFSLLITGFITWLFLIIFIEFIETFKS
tara:strand:- start:278 stop:772 length:495 start_codon:yes stop_codon:yes gene_type:complete